MVHKNIWLRSRFIYFTIKTNERMIILNLYKCKQKTQINLIEFGIIESIEERYKSNQKRIFFVHYHKRVKLVVFIRKYDGNSPVKFKFIRTL